jgi:dihydroflavonol-4-reductase
MTTDNLSGKNILVTGASGFIGSFIVEEALKRGMNVWAAVRRSSSRQWLSDPRINFIELDFARKDILAGQLRGHEFHFVVHAAGVTKTLHASDFFKTNTEGTVNLASALLEEHMTMERFVFLSSLSVFGPVREDMPYTDISPDDTPCPNTAYGLSKLEAERRLAALEGLPCVILRPTGVYGPRERDYFLMAKSIAGHTDFAVGYQRQDLTFVYVKDVVQAALLACERGKVGGRYFLTDGQVYSSRAFSDLLQRELGVRWVLRVKAPLWVLRVVTWCGEMFGRATGHITALNNDKYHILRQRNWRCDISAAQEELGYKPEYGLERGVKLAVEWYKEHGWL